MNLFNQLDQPTSSSGLRNGFVRTVLGDIVPDKLGTTVCHEHILVSITLEQTLTHNDILNDLQVYYRLGGRSIVELTNIGMGRDAVGLSQISQETGLNIICGTGFYLHKYYPAHVHDASLQELEQILITEITQGIQDTGIRAGIVGEIGTSQDDIMLDEEKVLRASASAALKTGAPLSTHTSFGYFALEQLDIIQEEGLPFSRVSIGHLDLQPDPNYHTRVAEKGAFIQYDTFGKQQYMGDGARIECLLEMIRRGFTSQILLSCDITRPTYLKSKGGWGYAHLLEYVIPTLQKSGVDAGTIWHLLVDNPQRFLTFAA